MEVVTVKNAMEILLLLQEEGPMGVRDIGKALSINKSTVHRLLYTLKQGGFVSQNEETEKYWLGLSVYSLGETMRERLDVRSLAEPVLRALAQEVQEYIHLAVLDDIEDTELPHLRIMDRILMAQNLTLLPQLRALTPCHCSAMGKCLLAFSAPDYVQQYEGRPLPPRTENTIVTWDALYAALREVRENGYATENSEIEIGLACVAFPIFDRRGKILASFSVTGPEARIAMKRELIMEKMKEASKALSYIY